MKLLRMRLLMREVRNFNLEYSGPLFSGDEQAVVLRIVGDAVEDRFRVDLLGGRQ
jgi:hypothetical protein